MPGCPIRLGRAGTSRCPDADARCSRRGKRGICTLSLAAKLLCNALMDRRVFLAASCGLLASRPLASRPAIALPSAAPRRIKLHNAHTGENFDGPYRDEHGPIAAAMEDLSHLLRDHHSGERI